ncbi:MAG: hypothetical protein Q9M15_08745 [Mariprofundaceae bacterium]|nr:hypothetical protein [Mariprofundaceae bacterium]
MISPIESGIIFGPYKKDDCYLIEKSKELSKLSGIKIAEFVLIKGDSLWVVEAKSSIPKPTNEKQYNDFFIEIHDKLLNTVTITFNAITKRNKNIYGELPVNVKGINIQNTDIYLRLVIPTVPKKFLPPMTDKMRKVMSIVMKTWGIKDFQVQVLNEDMLISQGLKNQE